MYRRIVSLSRRHDFRKFYTNDSRCKDSFCKPDCFPLKECQNQGDESCLKRLDCKKEDKCKKILEEERVKGQKKVMVLMGEGTEDIELAITINLLRKAGLNVVHTALYQKQEMRLENGLRATAQFNMCQGINQAPFSAIVIPGGVAFTERMMMSREMAHFLKKYEGCALIAALSTSPLVLMQHKVGIGKKVTGDERIKDMLSNDYTYIDQPLVKDGLIITSKGLGTSFQLAFAIIEELVGAQKVAELKKEEQIE